MTDRHVQAAVILECLRRRDIWVSLRHGEIDLIPPPGKRWQRRIKELISTINGSQYARGFRWEIKVWLRWEQRQEWRKHAEHRRLITEWKPIQYKPTDFF